MLLGNLEVLGAMPAGLIEDQDGVRACGDSWWRSRRDELHGFGVAERQNEGGAGSRSGHTAPNR